MYKWIAPLALVLAAPAVAQDGTEAPAPTLESLTPEQATILRCSVTFAAVAEGQESGDPRALAFPPMEERGQEFFVLSLAQLMDELGIDEGQVQDLALTVAESVFDGGPEAIEGAMPACLALLDASGL